MEAIRRVSNVFREGISFLFAFSSSCFVTIVERQKTFGVNGISLYLNYDS